MHSEIKTITYPNGDIQRIQTLRWDSWQQLEFFRPTPSPDALVSFERIYRKFLVPACPWIFGNLVLFRLPEDLPLNLPMVSGKYGSLSSPLTAATAVLEEGLSFRMGRPVFRTPLAQALYRHLEAKNLVYVVRGKLPITTLIPVTNTCGRLTETEPDAPLKVNAHFFIMDRFDCATGYDQVGTPFGLCVKDGVVETPPLYRREALLVRRDGSVSVETPELSQLQIEVEGTVYTPGVNCRLYTRPERARTPSGCGKALVVIGRRVAAVHRGSIPIPASGFVLRPTEPPSAQPGARVTYRGMEDILFGIQVGNSILRRGEKTETFRSPFYNIRRLEPIPYPPSLYPMDFRKGRAARIALGADAGGKPMLLWAEGAPKLGHIPGKTSCGASLHDMARLCSDAGMVNAVNLDGGGSAQILLSNRRSLEISDRKETDHSQAERPIPLGLILR